MERFRLGASGAGLLLAVAVAAAGASPPNETPPAEPSAASRDIAVLPLLNRTGEAVPVARVRDALVAGLADRKIEILDRSVLEKFMRRNRMRYTGGIDAQTARALRVETGAPAVLVTTLDLYQLGEPPKVGLTARLVSTGEVPAILWMDSVVESGDESPGLLGLGLISDPEVVLDRVTTRLVDSLSERIRRAVAGEAAAAPGGPERVARRFRPKVAYASPDGGDGPRGRIAVLPFANESTTRHAGAILTDQLVRHLAAAGGVVIEPGVVRRSMLETRQIQPRGPSVPQVDVLRSALDVRAVIYGEVTDYREAGGGNPQPLLGFTLRAVDTASRQVVWSSVSHTEGDDGVFFFDVGQVSTAYRLASELARAIVLALREGGLLPSEAVVADETLAALARVGEDAGELRRLLAAAGVERRELAAALESSRRRKVDAEERLAAAAAQIAALEAALAAARREDDPAAGTGQDGAAGPTAEEVRVAVRAWAGAWAEQRVEDYLASYSQHYRPAAGGDLDAWRAARRVRLSAPRFIELDLGPIRVETLDARRARASFQQSYRSDTFADRVDKTLELVREAGGWKIVRETVR